MECVWRCVERDAIAVAGAVRSVVVGIWPGKTVVGVVSSGSGK